MAQPPAWKPLASTSTSTFTAKTAPSKTHLHKPIPDDLFPRGYLLGGVHSGVKKDPSLPDLAVLLSTSSRATHSKRLCKDVLRQTLGRAPSSSTAAARMLSPAAKGLADAWVMARATDALLAPPPSPSPSSSSPPVMLVMSTGVIRQTFPISEILTVLRPHGPLAGNTLDHGFASWDAAAGLHDDRHDPARRWTNVPRCGRRQGLRYVPFRHTRRPSPPLSPPPPQAQALPRATLLGCIATDTPVASAALQSALDYAVQRSFNAISVDGDMSTNDAAVLFANGTGVDGD